MCVSLQVKSKAEDEVVSDAGSSITQEMNGHTKRLQLINHKRLTLATPVSLRLSHRRAKNNVINYTSLRGHTIIWIGS